jgi:hypothetical protein
MMITELIAELQSWLAKQGDLEVRGTWEGIDCPIFAIYRDRQNRLLLDVDVEPGDEDDREDSELHHYYRVKFEHPDDRPPPDAANAEDLR